MRRHHPSRALIFFSTVLLAAAPNIARAVDTAIPRSLPTAPPSNIVIGFVGGFVNHDNAHHGPVQFAQRLQRDFPTATYVRVFENRRRKQAYNDILRLLDTNRDGVLSPEEKTRARIVLFGHSWGASAAVLLARELGRLGIPVLLTVQVDSVAKVWQQDSLIPDNVTEAVNFYQTQGFLHGRRTIVAADPAKTEILGNYRMDYKNSPVQCPEASWWYRVLTPGHMQSECDPHLWSQIENLVSRRLSPPPTSVAVSPADRVQPTR